nr:MAP/microtubule affinity-regulating kinase 4 [Oryctolagus cuniculus]XP_051707825.1 MAP/microtubule affinity-regulating kinase 4 [Oryctolagus cuniculus]XP_051707826.1 MAP/microtubule affinity-regulating kinase 4 [Oryctolagus cuniculus]XP_051707827.1 MAP/microtubule affinity-regulating kinase 4 [Oryctolagus cuniculus]
MEGHAAFPSEEEVLDGYQVLRTIGQGSFGRVKLAHHLESGTLVAVKIIAREDQDSSSFRQVQVEADIMRGMRHPNIIRLLQVQHTAERAYIFMDYASGGDLEQYVAERGRLREAEARLMFNQALSAVHYCHSKRVVHRDLKLENFLLDAGLNIKLTDFGLSCRLTEGQHLESFCGTPQYCAPEEFLDEEFNGYKADVWSLGVVLYTMTTGSLPFVGKNWVQLEDNILSGYYQVPLYMSLELEHLLGRLLTYDPGERPTVADTMGHQWLSMGQEEPRTSGIMREEPLGSPQEKEIRECLLGLGFQLGRKEQDSHLTPILCWEISQQGDFSGPEKMEVTDVEPLGSTQDPEVRQYLAGLGFELGHKEESLTHSHRAVTWSPVLQKGHAGGKCPPQAAPSPHSHHVAQRLPDRWDRRGSARECALPISPLLQPEKDPASEPSACQERTPRMANPRPGMMRRCPTPRPAPRQGSVASLSTLSPQSSEDHVEDRSCFQGAAEKASIPGRQLEGEAGTSATLADTSQGRQGLCRRLVNFLLRVCGVLSAPEAGPGVQRRKVIPA